MSTIRKALLPTGIALAFLLFLGAVGSTPAAFAGVGDICAIDGRQYVSEDSVTAIWVTIDAPAESTDYTVTVDDQTGDGDIAGVLDGDGYDDLEMLPGLTSIVQDLEDFDPSTFSDSLTDVLEGHYGFTGADSCGDTVVLVLVVCYDIGLYQVSFADEGENDDSVSMEVDCRGDVDSAEIVARPTSVEIAPSYASVSGSLITVTLLDDNDEPAVPGSHVLFQTDRCSIEESSVDTEGEFEAAEATFRALNVLNPQTARDVENDVIDLVAVDGASPKLDETSSFSVVSSSGTERTVAAALLLCDPILSSGVTPGVATVTAIIERDGDDIVKTVTVTVVGPPAANGVTVTASPASLICGEKATIVVNVKDSTGQAVSDHTLVEAVTNAGGVLAGNGAVAGWAGPVVPISSTVAETFGGTATIYLLTSTQHVGKYEVVVTTGGGGGVTGQLNNGTPHTNYLGGLFTTAPISVQVTVECSVAAAAPAPTVKAPATGQGITPPSTGDAGLATSESSSLTLVIGAVVAAMVFGGLVITRVRQD